MNNDIYSLLKEFGLKDNEVQIYQTVVSKKELNAYYISKITGIHRSTTYDILDKLIHKGFISKIQKNKKYFFSANPISEIISKIKTKELILLKLIPEIEKIHEKNISNVRVLDNKYSQKQFIFNLFNQLIDGETKELYIISGGPTNGTNKAGIDILLESLTKTLKHKRNIEYKGIWNSSFKNTKLLNIFDSMGKNRYLQNLPTLATTVIYGEYIAFMFTINEKPQVIEIQNNLIATEQKIYFNYLWEIAQK